MNYDDFSDTSSLTSLPSSIPSSPLSSPPTSPIPPPGWRDFTPPPSQGAGEDMPPARKRRKIEPRVRTSRHLDLTSDTAQSDYDRTESLEVLLKALRKRRKIVVVAGAGISVSAGIPDFRSSHGLFRSLKNEHKLKGAGKELFDAAVYKDDAATSSFHDMVRKLSKMSSDAKPTLFHRLLARLSVEGRLLRLYTQNVDGLETELPPLRTQVPLNYKAPWPQTIQLHGGLEKMICQKCRHISEFQPHLFDGPVTPECPECRAQDTLRTTHAGKRSHGVGRLRPRIVLYNEQNPDEEAIGAVTAADLRTRPDAVIVVGTSMKIPGVRRIVHEMCNIVRDRREGTTIWINRDPVPTGKDLENCWDLIVKGDSDSVARLACLREWDDDTSEVVESYTDSDVERIRSSQGEINVVVNTPKKHALSHPPLDVSAMTPPMSPKYKHIQVGEGPVKPPSAKITITIPALRKSSPALKNPASEGRKIVDVIPGKENKIKSKISHNKVIKKHAKSSGMRMKLFDGKKPLFAQVTKPSTLYNQQSATMTKKQVEPLKSRRDSDSNIVPPQIMKADYSSTEGSPMPETPPGMMTQTPPEIAWDVRSRSTSPPQAETISPKGKVPRGMAHLLN